MVHAQASSVRFRHWQKAGDNIVAAGQDCLSGPCSRTGMQEPTGPSALLHSDRAHAPRLLRFALQDSIGSASSLMLAMPSTLLA
ncbi:hypothetical protein CBOM_07654 [Ceraceosorus bombacis]|uniref:Uncharacterized protein n=1 Tax=Ceraceosorus bombacis TaxID=401625 RepID=A0A0P1BKN2_9BASI|nr:hypothetical protein CBOM_07654 [Ceraceosorus bombacis]